MRHALLPAVVLAGVVATPAVSRPAPIASAQAAQPLPAHPRACALDVAGLLHSAEASGPVSLEIAGMAPIGLTPSTRTRHDAVNATAARGRAGETGAFVLAQSPGGVEGCVWTDSPDGPRAWLIRGGPDGTLRAIEADPHDTLACAGGLVPGAEGEAAPHLGEERDQNDASPTLDPTERSAPRGGDDPLRTRVLITYDNSADSRVGDFDAYAAALIESANTAYENSEIGGVRLELAGVEKVESNPSANSGVILRQLTNRYDLIYDSVHVLRDALGADLVAHITDINDACGRGWVSPNSPALGYTVSDVSCALSNLTFAHETGHNRGCAHDPDNAGSSYRPYGFGHRWNGNANRSVMAYSPGTRRPYFSNPDVIYNGEPTGITNQRDNARLIEFTAQLIANMRLGDGSGNDCDGDGANDALQILADPLLDRDNDGALDSCQIMSDPALDCNSDGQLDSAQARPVFSVVLGNVNNFGDGATLDFSPAFTLPQPAGDVALIINATGDLSSSGEYIGVDINAGAISFNVFTTGQSDCSSQGATTTRIIGAAEFASLIDQGLDIRLTPSASVGAGVCTHTNLNLSVSYPTANATLDADGDGTIDACACPADFTGDGSLNFFDISEFLAAFNAAEPAADLNGDDRWNFFDVSDFLSAFAAGCP